MLLRNGRLGRARYALTDRLGGVSRPPFAQLNLGDHVGDDATAVSENRRRLLAQLTAATSLALMTQVHGRDVAVVTADRVDDRPTADALVTATPGVALVVLSADCVPVLLAGRVRPVVAAVHAGRRGVQSGLVGAAIAALGEQGVEPRELVGLVGPAVCGLCYEVPEAMADQLATAVPAARSTTRSGTPALDLPAAVAAQLGAAGVADVEVDPTCTVESGNLFSHRRDGVTGQIAGVVWLAA